MHIITNYLILICFEQANMKTVSLNSDNCLILDKSSMIIKFTEFTSNETIKLVMAKFLPFVSYDLQEYHNDSPNFALCGPVMLLMRELAILRQARLILNIIRNLNMFSMQSLICYASLHFLEPVESEETMLEVFNAKPDFIAIPTDAILFQQLWQFLQWMSLELIMTHTIGSLETSYIAYRRYPINLDIFHYTKKFSSNFVALSLISYMILALIFTMNLRTRDNILIYLSLFTMLFHGRSLPKFLIKPVFDSKASLRLLYVGHIIRIDHVLQFHNRWSGDQSQRHSY